MKRSKQYFPCWPTNLLLTGVAILVITSCEPTPINFTRTDRKLIDSLFQKQRPDINKEIDSLCRDWTDNHIKEYKDSLLAKRWAEIEQILKSEE